ncbi:hypothetical protein BAE44_0006945 [Dichanthelium oligosanthes]|uniref:RING-type domain-containing protein n=1 Tax=Dichanthelium oligosanthes TaxID=888268 RepID=A0A1E5W3Q1_9POAL|nr:hypothetical protein BAE44_0006945 [Dichanthelium oligosanthes]
MSSSSLARYDATVLLASVAALSGAVAFVAALHLYARCLLRRRVALAERNPRVLVLQRPPDGGYELEVVSVVGGAGACGQDAAGLDARALRGLPVFTWESSKVGEGEGVAAAGHDGQCAVCLGEMEDGELGRLLPACRHVFHVQCIDTWLGVSSTCPVCRTAAAAAPAAANPAPASLSYLAKLTRFILDPLTGNLRDP